MKKIRVKSKILYIVLLILVAMFASVGTVFAERIIASSKVTYSNGTSGLSSTNVQGALDELYTKYKCINAPSFATHLKSLAASDTVIADDGTADHNMRYMGASPNNYVTFNGELWRVIGAFNNVGNGSKNETRVKIIKAESIGIKAWDNNDKNIWKNATLNSELQASSYASNSMVENAVWHLGDPGDGYTYTTTQAYTYERGTIVVSGNEPTWTGKVGLMYPSDYGFASSACKDGAKQLVQYNATDVDCKGTDWLYLGSYEWLLSPYSAYLSAARFVTDDGYVGNYTNTSHGHAVRPVVYLKSGVHCTNCSDSTAGTQSNPFKLCSN